MKLKCKIITGYRDDQYETIDASELHKAYFLFMNPEKRGIFNNGVAIEGKVITAIKPDYHATLGWNSNYKITADDQNEIKDLGIDRRIREKMELGKSVAIKLQQQKNYKLIENPLDEVKLLV